MSGELIFRVEGEDHPIELADGFAPETLRAVIGLVPASIDIHCAKIAGSHIMWPVPFLARMEAAQDVLSMPPGAFFYWPERQYLEITYDALQAEAAEVNYLGRLKHDPAWLRDYAERQRREQGRAVFTAELLPGPGLEPARRPEPARVAEPLATVRRARIAAWEAQPEEIAELLARRGQMIPFGPLHMAEGEMRKLHELLWRLWEGRGETRSDDDKRKIAVFALKAAISRVAGFCHLLETGAVLEAGITCLEDKACETDAALEELILYCGRIAAWLDLHICWWPMNETTLGALGATDT